MNSHNSQNLKLLEYMKFINVTLIKTKAGWEVEATTWQGCAFGCTILSIWWSKRWCWKAGSTKATWRIRSGIASQTAHVWWWFQPTKFNFLEDSQRLSSLSPLGPLGPLGDLEFNWTLVIVKMCFIKFIKLKHHQVSKHYWIILENQYIWFPWVGPFLWIRLQTYSHNLPLCYRLLPLCYHRIAGVQANVLLIGQWRVGHQCEPTANRHAVDHGHWYDTAVVVPRERKRQCSVYLHHESMWQQHPIQINQNQLTLVDDLAKSCIWNLMFLLSSWSSWFFSHSKVTHRSAPKVQQPIRANTAITRWKKNTSQRLRPVNVGWSGQRGEMLVFA